MTLKGVREVKRHFWLKLTYNIYRVWITNWISLADCYNGSLIVIFLQMNNSLDPPVNSQSPFKHQSSIYLTRFHLETLGIVELIVSLELGMNLSWRNYWSCKYFRRRMAFLTEAFMRLNSSSMAKELRAKQSSITWNMAVRNLKE